jgi:hypothetical protein
MIGRTEVRGFGHAQGRGGDQIVDKHVILQEVPAKFLSR